MQREVLDVIVPNEKENINEDVNDALTVAFGNER